MINPQTHSTTIPVPGQNAYVRNRSAVIREVHPARTDDHQLIHGVLVEYLDDYSHPTEEYLIWEREIRTKIFEHAQIPELLYGGRIDTPVRFRAFINAFRWSSINRIQNLTEGNSGDRIISPWLSAVQVEDYQLYPILKALTMPRITLLLADDVGLGKTIEAGLILNELIARGRLRRIMVVCPASLQLQWQDEMEEKFSLQFVVINRDTTRALQKEYGIDVNPFSFHPRVIVSMDYLRQVDVMESFESASRSFAVSGVAGNPWDMLVLDEAHNIAPKRFMEESDRLRMVRQIIPYFEHRLFLTATPHNGFTDSFTGLLEVLNPLVFEQKPKLTPNDHSAISNYVVRRLKSDFASSTAVQRFTKRQIQVLNKEMGLFPKESKLFHAVRAYREKALQVAELQHEDVGRQKLIVRFLITLLTKRLLSGTYAFACTWWNHFAGMNSTDAEADDVEYVIKRTDDDITDDTERGQRELDASRTIGTWFGRNTEKLSAEINAINQLLTDCGWTSDTVIDELSGIPAAYTDSKWNGLIHWVRENLRSGKSFKEDERVIIFTEYKHTLDYLKLRFEEAGYTAPEVQTLYGGSDAAERESVKDAFNHTDSQLRILLVTDVASEGINLQKNCRYIIHYDIPWNPMRMEQRNGRVDRFGQSREVTAYHFHFREEADSTFLSLVVNKVEQVREDLGKVSEVLDQQIMNYFSGSRSQQDDASKFLTNFSSKAESFTPVLADKGSEESYRLAMQKLQVLEQELDFNAKSVAEMLEVVFTSENGRLSPHPSEDGVWQVTTIPPRWAKIIDDHLRLKKGRNSGATPKLVFDPSYFRTVKDHRYVYLQKSDTRLIRISHPLMRKALNQIKKSLWGTADQRDFSRLTIAESDLPQGTDAVLVLYAYLECYNELRENIHREVLEYPFLISGELLESLLPDLWHIIRKHPQKQLKPQDQTHWIEILSDNWYLYQDQLKELLQSEKTRFSTRFSKELEAAREGQISITQAAYAQRLQELSLRKEAKNIERLRKELEEEQKQMSQSLLFSDLEKERKDKMQGISASLEQLLSNKTDYLADILKKDLTRITESVIPKRFTSGYLSLQPLGVAVLISSAVTGATEA